MVSPYKNELGGKNFPPDFNLYGKLNTNVFQGRISDTH